VVSAAPPYLMPPVFPQSQKEELERLKRDLRFAEERAQDATSHKDSEVSGLLKKYNRQLTELEESLVVSRR
jgi:DNA repair photolyase